MTGVYVGQILWWLSFVDTSAPEPPESEIPTGICGDCAWALPHHYTIRVMPYPGWPRSHEVVDGYETVDVAPREDS